MSKVNASQILKQGAQLTVVKLSPDDSNVKKMIEETRQRQEEVLKLKEVDQEGLKTVIQL